jgi:hypothetical protein
VTCPVTEREDASTPISHVISEKTTAKKDMLIVDYDDQMSSYESQYSTYRTWLDEDARAGSVLRASMNYRFATDIVVFEQTH